MNDWEIKQLRYFKVIYELSSISNAAAHLGLTQSALTKSLKKLEERLSLVLFHRHTRELSPTDAATALYENVLNVLASAQDFSLKVAQITQGNFGQVNIACGPLIQQLLGETLVEKSIDKLPHIKLQISGGNFQALSYGLLNHEFDFLLYDAGDIQALNEPERFEVTPLLQLPVVFVVSPKHVNFKDSSTVLDYKWALPSLPIRFKSMVGDKHYSQILSAGIPHYQMESMEQCLNLARRGLVMTASLQHMVQKDLDSGNLVMLDVPMKATTNFALYCLRSRKLSEQALSMMGLVKAIFEEGFKSSSKTKN